MSPAIVASSSSLEKSDDRSIYSSKSQSVGMLPLEKKGVLLETSAQTPSPGKDYINFSVTTSGIIWRQWSINPHCLRPDVKVSPTELKVTHSELLHDIDMQADIKRVFGEHLQQYVLGLCQGHYDYISRISTALQIYIISFLELQDIAHLAQTSKHFHNLCNSEQLWEDIVTRHCDTVTEEMKDYALEVGWKHVFFTNKLQLQAQLRRHQQRSLFTFKP